MKKYAFITFQIWFFTLAIVISISASAGTLDNALLNLRSAQWLIDSHPGDPKKAVAESYAKSEILAAMMEVKKAGIDDHKDISEHPAELEKITNRKERLMNALDILKNTRALIARADETTQENKNIKTSCLAHIGEAEKNIQKMISELK